MNDDKKEEAAQSDITVLEGLMTPEELLKVKTNFEKYGYSQFPHNIHTHTVEGAPGDSSTWELVHMDIGDSCSTYNHYVTNGDEKVAEATKEENTEEDPFPYIVSTVEGGFVCVDPVQEVGLPSADDEFDVFFIPYLEFTPPTSPSSSESSAKDGFYEEQ